MLIKGFYFTIHLKFKDFILVFDRTVSFISDFLFREMAVLSISILGIGNTDRHVIKIAKHLFQKIP